MSQMTGRRTLLKLAVGATAGFTIHSQKSVAAALGQPGVESVISCIDGTVRDRFWIWGHTAGSHNGSYGLAGNSRMTPLEGALYLGIPNTIMVGYKAQPAPPYEQFALSLTPLKRVIWSIVGAGGSTTNDEVDLVKELLARFPNFIGVMMDDFFRSEPDSQGNIGVHTPDKLREIRSALSHARLWVVLYSKQLHLPVKEHLQLCDVVTVWTWEAKDLPRLEQTIAKVEDLAPAASKVLGCYMWDYGAKKPMPVDLMEFQCETGLAWLRSGRIDGMIFLASCICDLGIETVEWSRRWIEGVGDQRL